ncbi:hypothetical protein [Streptomyces subrutilus]|uniref:DUF7144 domain-containing protein n=1 Tax=Streptomyces subrutilus TaxID=36818 RepID=A0A5P2UE56_9ACTN|nr:hypothetical protein [Streptomyces subrutilus]QEU77268.1 hypothetical protein CP968_02245 [Streptomyces subrutilus]WSJ33664.1 hypothetical protein OG479_32560 [Streptomyces subrutilus]GGZ46046.1 hypothetical protein GCM10010371_01380 [Streptomyces subrutilus]
MAHQTATPSGAPTPRPARPGRGHDTPGWTGGGVVFAGVLLFVDGVLAVLNGIGAIANGDVYQGVGDYTFRFDLTSWGWIHLILGVILLCTGVGILGGHAWARYVGIAMAALSIIANFMWLPYQPLWAVVVIAIDLFVIWALADDRTGPAA